MPFIQRFVKPIYVSRAFREDAANATATADAVADDHDHQNQYCRPSSTKPKSAHALVNNHELENVVNNTLSNELRQLGSLLLIANSIFVDLGRELNRISQRSSSLNQKIAALQLHVENLNPKNILVPAEDLCSFATRKTHYESKNEQDCCLFNARSRPKTVQDLYNAAAKSPVTILEQLDRFRGRSHQQNASVATRTANDTEPAPTTTHHLINFDIETRIPALVKHLRQWTSSEILGDLTVNINHPNQVISSSYTNYSNCDIDCSLNANFSDINLTFSRNGFVSEQDRIEVCNDNGITHKLPSPEEQVQTIANKFSSKVLPIDVSGNLFDKLSEQRRSMIFNEFDYVKKQQLKVRSRKFKGSRRRNTLAGTDQKELREALNAHSLFRHNRTVDRQLGSECSQKNANIANGVSCRANKPISQSVELRVKNASGTGGRKLSHFSALKQWSRNTLRKLNLSDRNCVTATGESRERDDDGSGARRNENGERQAVNGSQPPGQKENVKKVNGTFESSNGNGCVRLRETFSIQRRLNRLGIVSSIREEVHSSSGNWSASSESGRTSLIYDTIVRPKSTCSINSSSVVSRRKLTPDLTLSPTNTVTATATATATTTTATSTATSEDDNQDFNVSENGSVYSCDAEGYYTSFHLDSGLKPLKEEEFVFSNRNGNSDSTSAGASTDPHTHDNRSLKSNRFSTPNSETFVTIGAPSLSDTDYDVFGKESASTTTTSSAGTVCTTLMKRGQTKTTETRNGIPSVPERKSSLKAFGKMSRNDSPDSGHNTSSSPIDSTHSLSGGQRSGSELDCSESSSLEVDAAERIERRIRLKTHINATNTPSMCCAITPPPFQSQHDEIIDCSESSDTTADRPFNHQQHAYNANCSAQKSVARKKILCNFSRDNRLYRSLPKNFYNGNSIVRISLENYPSSSSEYCPHDGRKFSANSKRAIANQSVQNNRNFSDSLSLLSSSLSSYDKNPIEVIEFDVVGKTMQPLDGDDFKLVFINSEKMASRDNEKVLLPSDSAEPDELFDDTKSILSSSESRKSFSLDDCDWDYFETFSSNNFACSTSGSANTGTNNTVGYHQNYQSPLKNYSTIRKSPINNSSSCCSSANDQMVIATRKLNRASSKYHCNNCGSINVQLLPVPVPVPVPGHWRLSRDEETEYCANFLKSIVHESSDAVANTGGGGGGGSMTTTTTTTTTQTSSLLNTLCIESNRIFHGGQSNGNEVAEADLKPETNSFHFVCLRVSIDEQEENTVRTVMKRNGTKAEKLFEIDNNRMDFKREKSLSSSSCSSSSSSSSSSSTSSTSSIESTENESNANGKNTGKKFMKVFEVSTIGSGGECEEISGSDNEFFSFADSNFDRNVQLKSIKLLRANDDDDDDGNGDENYNYVNDRRSYPIDSNCDRRKRQQRLNRNADDYNTTINKIIVGHTNSTDLGKQKLSKSIREKVCQEITTNNSYGSSGGGIRTKSTSRVGANRNRGSSNDIRMSSRSSEKNVAQQEFRDESEAVVADLSTADVIAVAATTTAADADANENVNSQLTTFDNEQKQISNSVNMIKTTRTVKTTEVEVVATPLITNVSTNSAKSNTISIGLLEDGLADDDSWVEEISHHDESNTLDDDDDDDDDDEEDVDIGVKKLKNEHSGDKVDDCGNKKSCYPPDDCDSDGGADIGEYGEGSDDANDNDDGDDDEDDDEDDDDFCENETGNRNRTDYESAAVIAATLDAQQYSFRRSSLEFPLHTIIEESCEESSGSESSLNAKLFAFSNLTLADSEHDHQSIGNRPLSIQSRRDLNVAATNPAESASSSSSSSVANNITDLEKYFYYGLIDTNANVEVAKNKRAKSSSSGSSGSGSDDGSSSSRKNSTESLDSEELDKIEKKSLEFNEMVTSKLEKYFRMSSSSPSERKLQRDNTDEIATVESDESCEDVPRLQMHAVTDGPKRVKRLSKRSRTDDVLATEDDSAGKRHNRNENTNFTVFESKLSQIKTLNRQPHAFVANATFHSRDSGFVDSCDDLQRDQKTGHEDRASVRRPYISIAPQESSWNGRLPEPQTSLAIPAIAVVDDDTNKMMSKMRQFLRKMLQQQQQQQTQSLPQQSKSGDECKIPKPAQLVYFENELTRLMQSVPGLRDEQVRELVEYLSSEDTWSDSCDSSDHCSSDYDTTLAHVPVQAHNHAHAYAHAQTSADFCKDKTAVYQKLMRSFYKSATPVSCAATATATAMATTSASSTDARQQEASEAVESTACDDSNPLLTTIMDHIGSRLMALMHEVSLTNYDEFSKNFGTSQTNNLNPSNNSNNSNGLLRSKSHDLIVDEKLAHSMETMVEDRETTSDYEQFSWRGSFESALLASDSRAKLANVLEPSSSAMSTNQLRLNTPALPYHKSSHALLMSTRRSAGDLLGNSNSYDQAEIDRVRSCDSLRNRQSKLFVAEAATGSVSNVSFALLSDTKAVSDNLLPLCPSASVTASSASFSSSISSIDTGANHPDTTAVAINENDSHNLTLPRNMLQQHLSSTPKSSVTNSLPQLSLSTDDTPEKCLSVPRLQCNNEMSCNKHDDVDTETKDTKNQSFSDESGGLTNNISVKSARYRPPGFQHSLPKQKPNPAVRFNFATLNSFKSDQKPSSFSSFRINAFSSQLDEGDSNGKGNGNGNDDNRQQKPSKLVKKSNTLALSSEMCHPAMNSLLYRHSDSKTRSSLSSFDLQKSYDDEMSAFLHASKNSSSSSLAFRSDSMNSVSSGNIDSGYQTAAAVAAAATTTVQGQIEFSLLYNYKSKSLEINVRQCRDLLIIDRKKNRSDPYIKVYLLPDKSKAGKRKTKIKRHTLNPIYNECLKYSVALEQLKFRTVWLTVWHFDIFGRNVFLGEVRLSLEHMVFDDPKPKWYDLQKMTEDPMLDSVRTHGDLMIALKFVPRKPTALYDEKSRQQSKGELLVLIKEARNIFLSKPLSSCNLFCKSYLLPDKQKNSKQKTAVQKKTLSPAWNQTLTYTNLSLDELQNRCLELTVWNHDLLSSNEFLGGIRLSLNDNNSRSTANDSQAPHLEITHINGGSSIHHHQQQQQQQQQQQSSDVTSSAERRQVSNEKERNFWKHMLAKPNFWVECNLPLRMF